MPLRGTVLRLSIVALLLSATTSVGYGQGNIDLSVYVSPQLRLVSGVDNGRLLEPGSTVGGSGVAVGYSVGGAIEFRVIDELYLRGGIDFSHKRQEYNVQVLGNDIAPAASATNLVTYQAIEIPVQAIYRFGFLNRKTNFLVGLGITALQFVGDPEVDAPLSNKDRTGFESLLTSGRSVSLFVGYDRYISNRVIVSLEPYAAYVPDRIYLESNTTARVAAEAGIRLRLTLDN